MNIQVASICKNEEDMIRPWLEHLLSSNYIEAIHINDTGSTDGTLDYINSYNDPRIHLYRTQFADFSTSRNFVLSKLNNPDWFIQLDIDELFNKNMEDGLEYFDIKTKSWTQENTRVFNIPHIKLYDFDKIWFHKPPTVPSWDGKEMVYSWQKDTITFYKGVLLNGSKYVNNLHERFFIPSYHGSSNLSLLGKETLIDLSDLEDDFYVIHYSKAKLHAEARRTGKSFEYCVGKKRREYRLLKPFVTNGKLYDREWALKANDSDIEQLGKDQLTQFIDIEGHVFPDMPFDVYNINNNYLRKYHEKNSSNNNL